VPDAHVKGLAFRSLVSAAQRLYGASVVDKIMAHLPDEIARPVKHNSFITSGWYPLPQYRALHDAIARATGKSPPELARALGRDATMDDFRGVYRVLTFVLSPEFLIRRAPGLWNRYYDIGSLTVPVARKGYAEAQFRGCVGFDRVLWEDAVGGAIAILEVCGARDLGVTIRGGGGDGHDFLDATCTWR
jgi:hypothetical protein